MIWPDAPDPPRAARQDPARADPDPGAGSPSPDQGDPSPHHQVPEHVRAGQKFTEPDIWTWLAEAHKRPLSAGKGTGGGVQLSSSLVVDLWAVQVPRAECSRHG